MFSSKIGSSSRTAQSSETGYNFCQKDVIEGLKLIFYIGQMYALAKLGHNISDFKSEADRYNERIQQTFGNAPNLMIPKMQEGTSKLQGRYG